jgi:hypothetical protein
MYKPPDGAENPFFGILAHGAGIDDKDIRIFRIGYDIAHFGQHTSHPLRISLILLTAVCVHACREAVVLSRNALHALALVFHFLFADKFAQ